MAQIQWDPGPRRPALAPHTVDVWHADLADAAARAAAPAALLSGDERERAARFAHPGDGERWAAARAILRALLGAYLGAAPDELRFAVGAHGKPALAAPAPAELRFNLSHSGDAALIAVAREREVGVDVELPRRAVDHVAIARRVLGDDEAVRLAALDPPERERAFLRAWVRWEAALKCAGTGIGGADAVQAAADPPWVCDLDLAGPGAAAVAVAAGPVAVRGFRWPAAPS